MRTRPARRGNQPRTAGTTWQRAGVPGGQVPAGRRHLAGGPARRPAGPGPGFTANSRSPSAGSGHPAGSPLRRKVLVRAGSGGGPHEPLDRLTARSQRLHYCAGMTITADIRAAIGQVPAAARTPPMTGTGRSATGPGSPASPPCWT